MCTDPDCLWNNLLIAKLVKQTLQRHARISVGEETFDLKELLSQLIVFDRVNVQGIFLRL